MSADMDAVRRRAIEAGERVYSKMEYDDPDESPLGVALRVAVDEAMSALAQQHARGVSVDALKRAVGCWHPDTCDGPTGEPACAPCRLARNRIGGY